MKWPLVWRRNADEELLAAKAVANRQRERADKAEADVETWRTAQQTAARQFSEADAANRRLAGRNRALAEQLEAAQVASGFDQAGARRTAARIARLRKAVAKARAEASVAAKTPDERGARLVAELSRSRQAHASLDVQCRTLQNANEAMTRELHDLRTGGGE
ncbi:hypothetical protein ACWC3Y_11160 [Streptomyces sp. NPDC001296]